MDFPYEKIVFIGRRQLFCFPPHHIKYIYIYINRRVRCTLRRYGSFRFEAYASLVLGEFYTLALQGVLLEASLRCMGHSTLKTQRERKRMGYCTYIYYTHKDRKWRTSMRIYYTQLNMGFGAWVTNLLYTYTYNIMCHLDSKQVLFLTVDYMLVYP